MNHADISLATRNRMYSFRALIEKNTADIQCSPHDLKDKFHRNIRLFSMNKKSSVFKVGLTIIELVLYTL